MNSAENRRSYANWIPSEVSVFFAGAVLAGAGLVSAILSDTKGLSPEAINVTNDLSALNKARNSILEIPAPYRTAGMLEEISLLAQGVQEIESSESYAKAGEEKRAIENEQNFGFGVGGLGVLIMGVPIVFSEVGKRRS